MDQNITWQASEYKAHDRDLGWYAGLFLFGSILVIWGLYSNNIISTILFVLIIFLVYYLSHQQPQAVKVELAKTGIHLNHLFYPYRNLKKFWVLHHPNHPHLPELHIQTKAFLNRVITIELENQDPEEVRDYLRRHLEEVDDYQETFVDTLIRMLKL